jgi:DNA (cytosine-5)-methyltransferase 1
VNYIELFAGCGGLSLGLKANGFKLVFANELGEMAARTFSCNLNNQGLKRLVFLNKPKSFKNLKLKSVFVGDIEILMEKILSGEIDKKFLKADLISGGPPCQGFSMAGLRKEGVKKNRLPFYFLNLVEIVRPKSVFIENVVGILHPFSSTGATTKTYKEIQKRLSELGYYSVCLKVKAESFGVPEHRPRVLFIGFKEEVFIKKTRYFNKYSQYYHPPHQAEDFEPVEYLDLSNKDINFINDFLRIKLNENPISVKEAIDDLSTTSVKSSYVNNINNLFGSILTDKNEHSELYNHEPRTHNSRTTTRFKVKQIFASDSIYSKKIDCYITHKIDKFSAVEENEISEILKTNGFDFDDVYEFLNIIKSKKHSQKVLIPYKPSQTILTIPDDIIHYNLNENRVLTVREEARIQSFPDNFVFHGKPTTGGYQRELETPQYTQVGNAVPPLLAYHVGKFIKSILS